MNVRRRVGFLALVVGAVVPIVAAGIVHPLHEDEPGGASIVAFELARSEIEAEGILATWEAEGVVDTAKAIQLFDLVYPLIYGAALALGCRIAADAWRRRGSPRLAAAAEAAPWPEIAFAAALTKFFLIGLALVAATSGLVTPLRRAGR